MAFNLEKPISDNIHVCFCLCTSIIFCRWMCKDKIYL